MALNDINTFARYQIAFACKMDAAPFPEQEQEPEPQLCHIILCISLIFAGHETDMKRAPYLRAVRDL